MGRERSGASGPDHRAGVFAGSPCDAADGSHDGGRGRVGRGVEVGSNGAGARISWFKSGVNQDWDAEVAGDGLGLSEGMR